MTATANTRTRAPRGIPAGGQFQTEPKQDSGIVDGGGPSGDGYVEGFVDDASDRTPGILSDQELFAFTKQQGRRIAARSGGTSGGGYMDGIGGDADDHQQELAVRMLDARRRNGSTLVSATPIPGHHEIKYGVMVSKFMTDITRTRMLRYEDRQGMVALNERIAELEELTGGALTSTERDVLAEEVRMSYPAGRRPSVGFQNRVRETPFDPMAGADHEGDGAVMLRHVEDVLRRTSEVEAGSDDDEADILIGLAKDGKRLQAKQQVWHAMGGPVPTPNILTDGKASALRKQMEALGGAKQVARRFSNGTSTVEDDKVLFGPWGEINVDTRYEIAELLTSRPDYADELFSAAVSTATSPRKKANDA